jgi:type I restriction enzyme S subunit
VIPSIGVSNYPTSDELLSLGRFDAAVYSEYFKREDYLIKNYKRGWANYEALGFDIGRGQNLQLSCIGQSVYSDTPKPNFYRLVAPTDISEYRTVEAFRYLGNKRELEVVKKGDVIFGAEGFGKGRCVILVDEQHRTISNIHGIIFHPKDGSMTRGIFLGCFLGYLRKVGIVDAIGAGGSGGSLAIGYLDQVPFPRFADDVQERIARLYHSPNPPPARKVTLPTFLAWHREWNHGLGIWELARELKALQHTLADVQKQIIEGHSVQLPF